MKFEIIKGNLIDKALAGEFDVIAHGCNCFCIQKAGIAAQMSKAFNTDNFEYFVSESPSLKGNFMKLGTIDWSAFVKVLPFDNEYIQLPKHKSQLYKGCDHYLTVINAYTQYNLGANLDYEALTLCMRKINHLFKNKHIGLPKIGCGIAGGIWDIMELTTELAKIQFENKHFKDVKTIIKEELKDCDVTICEL